MQNAERDTSSRNQDKGQKRIVTFVITCFSTTEFLESIEKTFHYIAAFVGFFIRSAPLRLGISVALVPDYLPNLGEVLEAFRQQYPGIPLELISLPNDEVSAQLQAYKIPPALVGTSTGGVVHFPGISAGQRLTRWPFHPIRWT